MATFYSELKKQIAIPAIAFFLLTISVCYAVPNKNAGQTVNTKTTRHPIYPFKDDSEKALLEQTAAALKMDEKVLLDLVPPQGGFFYGDCPNCEQGAQERQIEWKPEMGDKVQCKYCKQVYPSEKYPENGQVEVKTPTGKIRVFKYYQAPDGAKYWMTARRWYMQREYVEQVAYDLAQLYHINPTKYAEAGKRSSAILKRFAEVYPDFVARFDYPFRPKQFFTDGFPENVTPYRASKWYWWGYGDVSKILLLTYDILRDTQLLSDAERHSIQNDLFQSQLNWVANNDGTPLTNMHPTLWSTMAVASRVLEDSVPAEKVRKQMQQLVNDQFSFDGMWQEGSPSYHRMTARGLLNVARQFHPELSNAEADALAKREFPEVQRAIDAVDSLLLPDGRYTPLKDTWWSESAGKPLTASRPVLFDGLGYAILGMGSGGDQMQAHLNYSGRFGHHHFDSLNFLLFGKGGELYSDLGYSHSRGRPWTLATAAHNTVVIDQKSQSAGIKPTNARGDLQLISTQDPGFQVVEATAPEAYPGLATTYRRALIAVKARDGAQYVVDIFNVGGGKQHDWFLHGSADTLQTLELTDDSKPLPLKEVDSLLPAGFEWKNPRNEGDAGLATTDNWAYGLFREAQQATSAATVVATFRPKGASSHGVRTWILGADGSQYVSTKAWAIRNIGPAFKEDDAKLDERMRQALIVRRPGPSNQFVAVHCPFDSEVAIKNVTMLPLRPDGVALRIERTGGTDYVLYATDAKPRNVVDGKTSIQFNARAAIAHLDGGLPILKMIGGSVFSIGNQRLVFEPGATTGPLRKIQGNQYTVAANLQIKPGMPFMMRHGDGRTTFLHAAKVQHLAGDTLIETSEPDIFSGTASDILSMRQFPQSVFPSPHQVSVASIATSIPEALKRP